MACSNKWTRSTQPVPDTQFCLAALRAEPSIPCTIKTFSSQGHIICAVKWIYLPGDINAAISLKSCWVECEILPNSTSNVYMTISPLLNFIQLFRIDPVLRRPKMLVFRHLWLSVVLVKCNKRCIFSHSTIQSVTFAVFLFRCSEEGAVP